MRVLFGRLLMVFTAVFVVSTIVQAQAVLVEEGQALLGPNAGKTRQVREEKKNGSYLMNSEASLRGLLRGGQYGSFEHMRSDRRVGVGVEIFGRLGAVGLNFELNYTPVDAAMVGIGGGPGYNSVALGWKHILGGEALTPYFSTTLAHWSGNTKSSMDGTNPHYLEDRFLSANEKASGQFSHFFAVPAVGVQYNKLAGPSAGAALYAEFMFVVEASTMAQAPTGAIGALYYF
jgi:hypothetical protein